jgi:hypothetical protein
MSPVPFVFAAATNTIPGARLNTSPVEVTVNVLPFSSSACKRSHIVRAGMIRFIQQADGTGRDIRLKHLTSRKERSAAGYLVLPYELSLFRGLVQRHAEVRTP